MRRLVDLLLCLNTDQPIICIHRFVDRDMFMRFFGMAVGHVSHKNTPECVIGVSAEALESGPFASNVLAVDIISHFIYIGCESPKDVVVNTGAYTPENDSAELQARLNNDGYDDEDGEDEGYGGSDDDSNGGDGDMDGGDDEDDEVVGSWSDDEPSW